MKTYRYLFPALLLTAALLCGCGEKTPAPTGTREPAAQADTRQEITSVLCSDGALTLRFRLADSGDWQWVDDTSFPLDVRQVEELLAAEAELEALTPIATDGESEDYGLSASKSYLTVAAGDDAQVTYFFGEKTDGGYYCRSSADKERICVAPERIVQLLGRSIYDMALLPALPDLSAGALRSATVTRGDAQDRLTLSRGKWLRDGQDATAEEQVQKLASGLEGLSLAKCVDYDPAAAAAEICGLEPPAAQLQLELEKGSFVLRVGAYDPEANAYFVTVDEDTTIYLMGGDVPAVLAQWAVGG